MLRSIPNLLLLPCRRWHRAGWVALAVVACLMAVPAPLLAHAELVRSSPLPNASLVEGPDRLTITFSEPIDPTNASVELLDPQLRQIRPAGALDVDAEGTTVTLDLPPLDSGIYTVSYEVVSTIDGHATQGGFAFLVDPTGAQAPPTGGTASSSPSVDGLAIVARWLGLTGAIVAFGSLTTWWQAARPTLVAAASLVDRRPPWRVVILSGAAAVVGLTAYLALSARPFAGLDGTAGGLPFDVTAPFGSTAFAAAMRIAILAAVAATVLAGVAAAGRRGDEQRLAAAGVAGCVAVSLGGMSAAGHASSLGGPINVGVDWLHLVAAGAWLGGLPMVHAIAGRVARPGEPRLSVVTEILRRHGRLALVAAPLVVLTGLANSSLVLGSPRELVASGYGNLLLVKAVLVSLALGIGAANHLLARGRGRGGMAVLLVSELLVAGVAVMAAAAMVTMQPAAARQPVLVGPSVQPAHFFGEAGPSTIHASVSVPAPGSQSYRVTIRDAGDGRPRRDVQEVVLALRPPRESGLPTERIELEAAEQDALYAASGAYTPVVGEWGLDVIVRRTGAPDETASFGMRVSEPSEPLVAPPPDTGVGVPAPLAVLWGILPTGLAGWIPAAAAVAAAAAASFRRWRVPLLREVLVASAIILVLAAGSKSVVDAANAPSADDLAAYENATVGSVDNGGRVYLSNCASCHGTDGEGDGPVGSLPAPRPLVESLAGMSDAEVSYRIAIGLAGTPMPAFAASLSEQERLDLVSYLRQRWGSP